MQDWGSCAGISGLGDMVNGTPCSLVRGEEEVELVEEQCRYSDHAHQCHCTQQAEKQREKRFQFTCQLRIQTERENLWDTVCYRDGKV